MSQPVQPLLHVERLDTDGQELWLVDTRRSMAALIVALVVVTVSWLGLAWTGGLPLCFVLPLGPLFFLSAGLVPVCWVGMRRTTGGVQTTYRWSRIGRQPEKASAWGDCLPASSLRLRMEGDLMIAQVDRTQRTYRIPKDARANVKAFVDAANQAPEPTDADRDRAAQVAALLER